MVVKTSQNNIVEGKVSKTESQDTIQNRAHRRKDLSRGSAKPEMLA